MAVKEQESDFEPRHRILGAVILVSIAFIVFSVILNEQPQQLDPGDKAVGTEPDTRIVVTPVPSPQARSQDRPATRVVANPLAQRQPAKPEPLTQETVKVEPQKPEPVETAAVAKPEPSAPVSAAAKEKWLVQVGTFANPENARRLRSKLEAQKYQVSLKVVTIQSGQAVRVRVGPYSSKAGAERARDTINKKNGIKGVVLAQK
jgi:DedD protein